MKRPVEMVLVILGMVSLFRTFSGESSLLEIVGYIAIALLSAALIIVLNLRLNDSSEWMQAPERAVNIQSHRHASAE